MADNKPLTWAYPFKTAGEASKEVSDPQVYLDALAEAENGFYPMGANGLWHGGVHFDNGTATLLEQSEVRCIADGEVIAYRIDDKYPETNYSAINTDNGPAPAGAKYSTGFVLVKHRLELPPTPASATAPAQTPNTTETAPTPTEPEGLTFFSLYMHLLDCTGYQAQPTLKRPEFWGAGTYKVKADAPDKVLGLHVREHHNVATTDVDYAKYQNKLTTLPRGTTFETGEAAPNQDWRKLVRVTPAVAGLAENTGWVYVRQAKQLADNRYLVTERESIDVPALEQIGLHVREAANASSNVLAVLPRGTEIKISQEGARGKYLKLDSIISGNAVPALTANTEGKLAGYVWLDSLESQQTPNALAKDKVYPLPQAHSIKAGELIGHLGVYQDYGQSAPQPRLHLELFSCDDVPDFIDKSKARATTLPEAQKTLIKVDKGSKIIQPATADAQIETGMGVRICSDSPKVGRWAKVQKYATCNALKTTELGSFNSTNLTYSLSAPQKAVLAARMGVGASHMPDIVDFLKVSCSSMDGADLLVYAPGTSVAQTHLWRKIGAAVGEPLWVERAKLDAQGQRSNTAGALAAWSAFPLHIRIDGQACGYERILPASSWDGLPNERKAVDPDNVQWWYVTVGDVNGNDISGWAPEKDLIVSRHSPWEWPGFSTLQDKLPLDAHLARTLDATGRATAEETQSYAALIDAAEHGHTLSKLYEVIDLPDERGIRDNKLTPAELKTALGKPWLAQQLSLLISQYESEWCWNEGKWNALDTLMAPTPGQPNPDWEAEKTRIKTLSWWSELAGQPGIKADGLAWHFHPAGVIGSFLLKKRHPVVVIDGLAIELQFLELFDDSLITDNDYIAAATLIGCEMKAIKAVAITETGNSGSYFINDGDDKVPAILYERHYFHNKTNGSYSSAHPDISNSSPGGYGAYSSQYKKLLKAYALDSSAALKSASWGRFQIMGSNHAAAGYATVEDFVSDISKSEKNHLKAFVNFIKADSVLTASITSRNWLQFALKYNGPAQDGYDTRMEENYNAINNN